MPPTRLYVEQRLGPGAKLDLGADAARYLGRVLRLKAGDTLSVFNGDDGEWQATLLMVGKERVALSVGNSVGDPLNAHTESAFRIHLVQGISRGERMDFVVQKATELGVERITPVLSDHGMVRLDAKRAAKRRDHWQRVAQSACEQSGRTRPPLVEPPMPLNTWFGTAETEGDTRLILVPGAAASLSDRAAPATGLCLLIGPEGGFSERESSDAGLAGFSAVSLGPRILRTETAAVAALAIVQSRWGDM